MYPRREVGLRCGEEERVLVTREKNTFVGGCGWVYVNFAQNYILSRSIDYAWVVSNL